MFFTGKMRLVAGFILEGTDRNGKIKDGLKKERWIYYVTSYSVQYSPDGRLWAEIRDELNNRTRVNLYFYIV